MPPRQQFHTVSNFNLATPHSMQLPQRQMRHRRSSLDVGMSELGLDSIGHAIIPSSFATQMAMATGGLKGLKSSGEDTDGMMGRLLLARMKTLEEGLADMAKEFREMRTAGNSSIEGDADRLMRAKGKEKAGAGRTGAGSAVVRASSEVRLLALGEVSPKGKENEIPAGE